MYKTTVRKFEVACIGLGCHCHLVVHAVQLYRFSAEYGFLTAVAVGIDILSTACLCFCPFGSGLCSSGGCCRCRLCCGDCCSCCCRFCLFCFLWLCGGHCCGSCGLSSSCFCFRLVNPIHHCSRHCRSGSCHCRFGCRGRCAVCTACRASTGQYYADKRYCCEYGVGTFHFVLLCGVGFLVNSISVVLGLLFCYYALL